MKKILILITLILIPSTSYCSGIDSYTKMMLHCDGADTSTTFTDSEITPKTMTAAGNAQLTTANKKFGTASGLFDGTGDYVSTPNSADFDLGTQGNGNFTIDGWFRFHADATMAMVVCSDDSSGWEMWYWSGTGLILYANGGSNMQLAWTPTLDTWYHIAYVRNGGAITCYVNGTSIGNFASDADMSSGGNIFYIGQRGANNVFFNGWMDEIRVSKGIARWTSNFTPPTAPYDTSSSTPTSNMLAVFD